MYSYTDLRNCVKRHEKSLNEKGCLGGSLVEFNNHEKIFTEIQGHKVEEPTSARRILEFLQENEGYFSQPESDTGGAGDVEFEKSGNNKDRIFMKDKLEKLQEQDSFIVKYDDEGAPGKFLKLIGVELVYGIVLNR